MSNNDLRSFITAYGDRIFAINMDNSRTVFIGYSDSPKLSDIRFETIGAVDYFFVKHVNPHPGRVIQFEVAHLTECIQWIGILSENSKGFNPDPILFK